MFCTSCGTKNAADSNFCRQCGSKVEKSSTSKISPDDFERSLPEDERTMALLERAYSLRKSGDLDGAIILCEQSLRLHTESTSTHSLLGQLYEEKGNRAAAIGEYERVLALNPGSIADRVKLDELRAREEGSASVGPAPRPRPDERLAPLSGLRYVPLYQRGRHGGPAGSGRTGRHAVPPAYECVLFVCALFFVCTLLRACKYSPYSGWAKRKNACYRHNGG